MHKATIAYRVSLNCNYWRPDTFCNEYEWDLQNGLSSETASLVLQPTCIFPSYVMEQTVYETVYNLLSLKKLKQPRQIE